MRNIRVVLIEDHDLTRLGLKATLQQCEGIEVVDEAATGPKGLEALKIAQPDVAVIDIGLPGMDGIEVTQRYRAFLDRDLANGLGQRSETSLELEGQADSGNGSGPGPDTSILMLTMHDDEASVLAAFAAGADSYSLKDAATESLVEAIRVTHSGDNWIDPAIARIVLQQAQSQKTEMAASAAKGTTAIGGIEPEYEKLLEASPLTDRELDVLELIVAGHSNAQISEELYITVGTVKTHVCSILNKLCVDDRTQAAVRALRSGLVK